MKNFNYVPYPEDSDDPLFVVKDLEQFSRFCVKYAYIEFSNYFFGEVRNEEEILSYSDKECDDILPIDIAREECKIYLAISNESDEYLVNEKLISIIIRKLAHQIYIYHSNKLVDEGIMELVYLPEEEDFGYRLKIKE